MTEFANLWHFNAAWEWHHQWDRWVAPRWNRLQDFSIASQHRHAALRPQLNASDVDRSSDRASVLPHLYGRGEEPLRDQTLFAFLLQRMHRHKHAETVSLDSPLSILVSESAHFAKRQWRLTENSGLTQNSTKSSPWLNLSSTRMNSKLSTSIKKSSSSKCVSRKNWRSDRWWCKL